MLQQIFIEFENQELILVLEKDMIVRLVKLINTVATTNELLLLRGEKLMEQIENVDKNCLIAIYSNLIVYNATRNNQEQVDKYFQKYEMHITNQSDVFL